jgi:hypothetical protein
MKHIVILEHKYHDEIIYGQIQFALKYNYKVTVIITRKLYQNGIFKPLEHRGNVHFWLLKDKSILSKIRLFFSLKRFLNKNHVSTFVFNTLDGVLPRFLIARIPKSVTVAGILHGSKVFIDNLRLNWISTHVDRVAVLSEPMAEALRLAKPKLATYCIQPFYFEGWLDTKPVNKEILFVTPGSIELYRRDYLKLIHILEHHQPPEGFKFALLGNGKRGDAPEVLKLIQEKKLGRFFLTFDGFVPYQTFFDVLNRAQFILPLMEDNDQYYGNYRISGSDIWRNAFNLYPVSFDKLTLLLKNPNEIEKAIADVKPHFDANREAQRYLSFIEA